MSLTYHEITVLAEPLRALEFGDRVIAAHIMGLTVECCRGCGCYVGKPGCHPESSAVDNEFGEMCKGCGDLDEEDEDPNKPYRCPFNDSHNGGHLPTRTFRVLFGAGTDREWEDLTCDEMAARNKSFLHTSDWDFWYEDPQPGERVAACTGCGKDIIDGEREWFQDQETYDRYHMECRPNG